MILGHNPVFSKEEAEDLRKSIIIFLATLAGMVAGFLAVAGFIVTSGIGGKMRAIRAVEFGGFIGIPVGCIVGSVLGQWLARIAYRDQRRQRQPPRDHLI
jgi:hypothetical protein